MYFVAHLSGYMTKREHAVSPRTPRDRPHRAASARAQRQLRAQGLPPPPGWACPMLKPNMLIDLRAISSLKNEMGSSS